MLPFATLALATLAYAAPARIAQATPTQAPGSAATSSASPSATPSPSGDVNVRRGPGTAPRMLPPTGTSDGADVHPGDVTIRNSGSTNAAGYTIVVHPDTTAVVTVDGHVEQKSVGAAQAKWLLRKVREAAPLGALAGGGCMKSASFGSTTTISYDGSTTPDLTCGGNATTRELDRTVNVIVAQLGISAVRARGRLPG